MSDLLSKFIVKNKKEDVIHSSAFAKVQNSEGIGVASSQSFSDRMKIEQNRNRIRGYGDSQVVVQSRASSGIKAKTYTPPEQTGYGTNNGVGRVSSRVGGPKPVGLRSNSSGSLNSRPPMRKNPGISR